MFSKEKLGQGESSPTPFNKEKYIRLQSEKILERAKRFKKLYLEFGGKLFNDFHASRCLPGFEPDTKIKMLSNIKDKCEVIFTILAEDIERNRYRPDVGLTYDNEVLRLIDSFRAFGIHINSVVINKFNNQPSALAYKQKLEAMGIETHLFHWIEGYTTNVDRVLSGDGYGANPFIKTTKPIVIITGPGANSGKMSVALSQLYNEFAHGNKKTGYAKFETFPIWNLPLKHPVNLAYEASTVNVRDVNMIDSYHFEKYGEIAVNYNRDIQAFPLLQNIFRRMYGKDVYYSPTDMGVNMVGYCIEDDAAVQAASRAEVIRRYFQTMVDYKMGRVDGESVNTIKLLLNQIGINLDERVVALRARERHAKSGMNSASLQLATGEIITTSSNDILSASSKLFLKTLQHLLGVNKKIKILSDAILENTIRLKKMMDEKKPHLRLGEILIILSSSAVTNELSAHAMEKLKNLAGSEVHTTYMISEEEAHAWRKLRVNLTQSDVPG